MKNIKRNKIIISGIVLFCCGMISFAVILIAPSETYSDFSSQDISGDLVVTDQRTNLMWEVKTASNTTLTYTWENAILYCETTLDGYAGYSDWRLPNVTELQSLIDVEKTSFPVINTTYFPNTQSSDYWSATTCTGTTTNAWEVGFNNGWVYYTTRILRLIHRMYAVLADQ